MTPVSSSERFYFPGQNKEVVDRKTAFAAINRLISKRGDAWITSIPGARDVTMECIPGSAAPDEVRAIYRLTPDGQGQRMIPHAITEDVVTEGSTKRTIRTTHAGIVTVDRYRFMLP